MSIIRPGSQIVFVVDDEQIIATTLGVILQRVGYDSRWFYGPEEAVKAAHAQAPDLLVTDMIMPGMTGIELAKKIRESCPDCKVLLFSGQASFSDSIGRGSDSEFPFDYFLMKPVHPQVLLRKVEEILNDESMAAD